MTEKLRAGNPRVFTLPVLPSLLPYDGPRLPAVATGAPPSWLLMCREDVAQ